MPDEAIEELRTYCRHRANLLDQAADTTRRMQKYLRLVNLRLDVVAKDITRLTGLKIIGAICNGEVIPEKLASLRNGNCKRSEEEIAKALQNNGRKDYLFALRHEYRMYQDIQLRIKECDIEIEKTLTQQIMGNDDKQEHLSTKKFIKE